MVRLRLTVALPAIVTLLTFGAGILAVNVCRLYIFNPFGKLRAPPFHLSQAYIWVAGYALISGLIGFVFAYFILSRPMKKGLETIESFLPTEVSAPQGAETETILLSQTLTNLYPALGRLRMAQSLLEALQGGILWVGTDKTLLYANPKALNILGKISPPEKGAPLTLNTLTQRVKDSAPLLSIIENGITKRQYVSSKIITLTFGGERAIKLGVTSSPIGTGNHFEGVLLSFRELSEIQRLQKDLTQLDRLSTLGRLASGLVHEIRNPLGSLMGLLEILKGEISTEDGETRTLIDRIYQAAARIQHLLAEVLDFAGPFDVLIQRVSLHSLLNQAVDETSVAFQGKNFRLKKEFATGEDDPGILADSEKLKQALINILRNAMEAVNENGEVRVSVSAADSSMFQIEIFNTGSAIAERDVESIFDPFFTTKPRGTGLGLPIARELITLQGGELSLVSAPERGVSFYIRIPGVSDER